MIPKDPVMLLSYVNTQLRDYYDSLDDFLKDKELSGESLIKKLASMQTQKLPLTVSLRTSAVVLSQRKSVTKKLSMYGKQPMTS